MAKKDVIVIENLSKNYETFQRRTGFLASLKDLFVRQKQVVSAVADISFKIKEGELVGFIGPNGAGKTTTLKMLSGLLYPSGGKATVLGHLPWKRQPEFQKQFSLIMGQKSQLIWDLPAMDTFLLNKDIYEIPDLDFQNTIDSLSQMLSVKEFLHTPVRKLSLGQRMKMELIAALLHSPKLLFLDEPTIGLDVVAQENVRIFIKDYNKKFNATVILTSHYMEDVQKLCDRVIVIDKGKIHYDGKLDKLIQKHLPQKFLKLVIHGEVQKEKISSLGEIMKWELPNITIAVPRNAAVETATKLLKKFTVADLTIEEPQLEVIIRQIFRQ